MKITRGLFFGFAIMLPLRVMSGQAKALPQGVSGGIPGGITPPVVSMPPRPPTSSISGAPFSSEVISETVHVLRDGSEIVQRRKPSHLYRDSHGRIRADKPEGLDPEFNEPPIEVYIYDPVAKLNHTLDTKKKIALPVSMGPVFPRVLPFDMLNPPQRPPGFLPNLPAVMLSASGEVIGLRPQRDTQSLGTKQMEGVAVEGTKVTVALPAGWEGFDRPFEVTVEYWWSKELDVVLLWTRNDPRAGQFTWRLTQISRAEPAPTLFQVPPDYKSEEVHKWY